MLNTPEPHVRPVVYAVSCLPDDHPDAHLFTLKVAWRGNSCWVVSHGEQVILNVDGGWDFDRRPEDDEDAWLARHYFHRDQAMALATQAAATVVVSGMTVQDILDRDRGHPSHQVQQNSTVNSS